MPLAMTAIQAAYLSAIVSLRTGPDLVRPDRPSSLDVLAEAHKRGVVASQRDVLAACAALKLVLADTRSERRARARRAP